MATQINHEESGATTRAIQDTQANVQQDSERSLFEYWREKVRTGVFQALEIEGLWPGGFWTALCWLGPVQPLQTHSICSGLITIAILQSKFLTVIPFVLLWFLNLYVRWSIRAIALQRYVAKSASIRFVQRCLKRAGLWILGRPTHGQRQKFQYPPLQIGQRQFRLFRLHRIIPFLDIEADLVPCSLDDPEPYEAISYVWGDYPQGTHPIILNGKQFSVAENVHNILWRRSSYLRSCLIWIDTICIDQSPNSHEERGDQVRMMREIYEKASHVIVCLGETPPGEDWLATSLLNELLLVKKFTTEKVAAQYVSYIYDKRAYNEHIRCRLNPLLNLMDHPWFDRAWVVQEVVVARSTSVLYGSYTMGLESLFHCTDIMGLGREGGLVILSQLLGEQFVNRRVPVGPAHGMIMATYREAFQKGLSISLFDILRALLAFKSTVPRDKIFSLLGLTTSAADLKHIVDYTRPISDILVDIAHHFRRNGHLFEVLHLAGVGWDQANYSLPSWAVDWTISKDPVTLAHSLRPDRIHYQAAVQRPPQVSQGSKDRNIRLQGQIVDEVREFSDILEMNEDPREMRYSLEAAGDLVDWIKKSREIAHKWAASRYLDEQALLDAFQRTLIGNRTQTEMPAPAAFFEYLNKFEKFMGVFRELFKAYGPSLVKLQDSSSAGSAFMKDFPEWDDMMVLMREVTNAKFLFTQSCFPRRFCVTKDGYMGMVPKGTKYGDVICVIFGAQVPFVMREVVDESKGLGKRYQLVGECYLHDMMDGEAFELAEEPEDFEIV